ncbi:MAG TPA: hypothetical protein VEW48_27400 [Thermoanaerobaculia bacterium]|nr:hypothetical protein [Thermoanaerobaculia bacterium]
MGEGAAGLGLKQGWLPPPDLASFRATEPVPGLGICADDGLDLGWKNADLHTASHGAFPSGDGAVEAQQGGAGALRIPADEFVLTWYGLDLMVLDRDVRLPDLSSVLQLTIHPEGRLVGAVGKGCFGRQNRDDSIGPFDQAFDLNGVLLYP